MRKASLAQDNFSKPDARCDVHRDFIFEQLNFAIHRAGVAQSFLEVADDAGMSYALKGAVEHFKAAAQSANEMRQIKLDAQAAANDAEGGAL
jgi:hypothetical protein